MKKSILLLLAVLLTSVSYGQKAKKGKGKTAAKTTKPTSKSLAKADNVTAEFTKVKEGNRFYLIVGAAKDTVQLKYFTDKTALPLEVKITPFTTKGAKLHSVTWTEKRKIGEPKTKLEDIVENHTEIFDLDSKTNVYSNTESTNHITEVVFLDKVKVVSETREKIRREGVALTVLPDGDLLLKGKQSESRQTYKPEEKKFVAKK